MPNWEDLTGYHYVKDKPQKNAPKPEVCGRCGSPATCIGRLYVPASKMSVNQHAADVSVLLCGQGLFWCDRHFFGLKAAEFLDGERGQQIRDQVAMEFRKRNAYPSFSKAVIGRIPTTDPDYVRAQKAIEIARQA